MRCDPAAAQHGGGSAQVGQATVGAAADECRVDRHTRQHTGADRHIVVRSGCGGSGGDGLRGRGAPAQHRRDRSGVEAQFGIEDRVVIAGEGSPRRQRSVPRCALRSVGAPAQPVEHRVVGRDHRGHRTELGCHVAQCQPRLDVHRAHRRACILDRHAAPANGPERREQCQRKVLGGHPHRKLPVDGDAHRARPRHPQRPRRQRVLGLRRTDPPRQRAERTLRAGVTVGTDDRRAGQGETEFGGDDVDDALCRVADIENADPRRRAGLAGCCQKSLAAGHQRPRSPRRGVDDMVDHREHPGGIGHRSPGLRQRLQRDRPHALVKEDAVDGDQRLAVAKVGDDMRVPQLGEQRLR